MRVLSALIDIQNISVLIYFGVVFVEIEWSPISVDRMESYSWNIYPIYISALIEIRNLFVLINIQKLSVLIEIGVISALIDIQILSVEIEIGVLSVLIDLGAYQC